MGRAFVFDIPDVAGGLNESAPENISDREMATLENFYVRGTSVYSREGMEELAGVGLYGEKIFDIARYNPSFTDAEYILFGAAASIARVNGSAIEALAVSDGRVYPSLDTRWWHEQYNDEMFWCRQGNGGVKRIYGDSVSEAGMPAPTTAPLAIDGGQGKKEAGTYQFAYRWYNRKTGARSNWSPLSKAVTIEDAHSVLISEIAVAPYPQVNARQIGATQADGAVIYLVGQIDDNISTSYLENASAANDEYGEADVDVDGQPQTDFRHGVPPSQAWALALHKERLFVLNKEGIYWSEAGRMQSFSASSFIPVQKGTGLLSWEGHGLVITTETNAQILQGDTPNDWRLDVLSKEHGSPAGHSLAVADGQLFWYTGVNIAVSSGGAPSIIPRIERIRTTLDDIPEDEKDDVFAETLPSRGWYMLNVPQSDGTRKIIVYDYKLDAFQTLPASDLILAMARLGQPTQAEAMFISTWEDGTSESTVSEFLSGTTDNNVAITAKIRTKSFGYDRGVADKITRRVALLTNLVGKPVTIRVYHDGVLVATRSNVNLTRKWTRITIDTHGTPGATVAVEVEYSGTSQLRIDQMQIDGVNLLRRVVPV